jgi:hypothetical protein
MISNGVGGGYEIALSAGSGGYNVGCDGVVGGVESEEGRGCQFQNTKHEISDTPTPTPKNRSSGSGWLMRRIIDTETVETKQRTTNSGWRKMRLIDLKVASKSLEEPQTDTHRNTTSVRKTQSVDTLSTNISSPRSHLLSSPRLQTLSDLLEDASVTKIKKIGKGFGSGTTIWEVNVSLNRRKSQRNFVLFPNSENFDDWVSKVSHCCMKELSLDFAVQHEIDSFIEEIDKLRKLPENHNNIMQFLGFQITKDAMRVFTRLYDGTLSDLLKDLESNDQKLTLTQLVKFSIQISSALMVIHSRRMMHRDIKSGNVFYLGNINDLDNLVLVLGDYGESKYMDARNRAKTCVGTNVWIAPEVLTGKSKTEYSFEADMYSFGMLIYELITWRMPYYECKTFESVSKIINGEKPTFTTRESTLYENILNIWNSLVETHPEKRLTSAKTFCLLTDIYNACTTNDLLNV